ncbi:HPP family protein [Sneathiella chinensis]|nr:HPP family protein [Sneathiella chinensis]
MFRIFVCGIGAILTIGGLGAIGEFTQMSLLMAPLGASAVLLFAVPNSPLAQVKNQLGGHLIAAIIGLFAILLPYEGIWLNAAAVGLTVMLMMLFSVEHPPAGAVPLVMVLGDVEPGFVLGPVLFGTFFLGAVTGIFHFVLSWHEGRRLRKRCLQ